MLNFVDISIEDSYQQKDGSTGLFGSQIGTTKYPIDFQYHSNEDVLSFVAKKEDVAGNEIDTISLSTSLIIANGKTHRCTGLTAFSEELECGIYNFLVNGKYKSESFYAVDIDSGVVNDNSVISVSGLEFFDTNYDIPENDKLGASLVRFGREYGTSLNPLDFCYKSSQEVSTFEIVQVDLNYNEISRTSLATSLISSDGRYHKCSGLIPYTDVVKCGTYYFLVNNRFRSKVFEILEFLCPIITDIDITNAIEGETAVLTFNAYLTGAIQPTDIGFVIKFSNEIETIEITETLISSVSGVSVNVPIPFGTNGTCLLTIENNVCSKTYTYQFYITPIAINCLELYGGGNLELYNGECLQLYE